MVPRIRRGVGVAMVAVGFGAMRTFPTGPLPSGWVTPILAFEFARTPDDVAFLAGPQAEPLRAAMDAGHVWDTAFPLLYAGFLAVSAWPLANRTRTAAFACALLAAPLDLWENHVLGELVDSLRVGGDLGPGLAALFVATWAKWAAIAAALAALGWACRRDRPALAAISMPPAVLVPIALLTAHPVFGEALSLAVFLGALAWLVDAWRPTSGV